MPTVLLDPGHGFDDVGCGSEFLGETWEKNLTLDMAKKLGELLTERGCTVLYTHDGVTFPSVSEITSEAKRLALNMSGKSSRTIIFSAPMSARFMLTASRRAGYRFLSFYTCKRDGEYAGAVRL